MDTVNDLVFCVLADNVCLSYSVRQNKYILPMYINCRSGEKDHGLGYLHYKTLTQFGYHTLHSNE